MIQPVRTQPAVAPSAGGNHSGAHHKEHRRTLLLGRYSEAAAGNVRRWGMDEDGHLVSVDVLA